MSDVKKVPRKLRNGPVIDIDPQVIRWREKMRKEGIALGKNMRKAQENREYTRKSRETDTPEKLLKKRFF